MKKKKSSAETPYLYSVNVRGWYNYSFIG